MSHQFLHKSALLLTCVVTTAALAQTPPDRPDTSGTTERSSMHDTAAPRKALTAQSFTNQVAVINKAEVELGQMALKNASDSKVKEFAQRMITDHTSATKQLQSLAAKHSLDVPQQLDTEHQALKDKLSKLNGEKFDKEYTKAMAKGHEKAMTLFESASRDTQLPNDLKQFAATTLPTLKEHHEIAESLEDGKSRS